MTTRSLALVLSSLSCSGLLAFAAFHPNRTEAGSTKFGQACSTDDDCSSGHSCYPDDDGKLVCIACSVSDLKYYTREVDNWCKADKVKISCQNNLPQTPEISRDMLEDRRDLALGCVAARQRREDRCWAGGNETHRQEIADYTKVANTCKRDISDKGAMTLLYTCSDATYSSLNSAASRACGSLQDCKALKLDSSQTDCDEVQDRIDKVTTCQESLDRLASSCFSGRKSTARQSAYSSMDNKIEYFEEVLDYKQRAGLCQ